MKKYLHKNQVHQKRSQQRLLNSPIINRLKLCYTLCFLETDHKSFEMPCKEGVMVRLIGRRSQKILLPILTINQ
jgi:hypothetical protein